MINISNISNQLPYLKFEKLYKEALAEQQTNIEAICISSFDKKNNESNSRFVNLKYIIDDEWIFFSNYQGPKAREFESCPNISAVFFWHQTNTQIRVKAKIYKSSIEFSDSHFKKRDKGKNILAISSKQSKPIESYDRVKENYNKSLKNDDLRKCPEHWGGFSFIPYYFEFWEGHVSRINKREVFDKIDGVWKHLFLQP